MRFKSGSDRLKSELYQQLVPEGLRLRLDVRRAYAGAERQGFVFIHVPRTGGTSIALANYGRPILHITAQTVEAYAREEIKRLPRVAVVRDPYRRLRSAYHFIKGGGDMEVDQRPEYSSRVFETFEGFVEDWLHPRRHELAEMDKVFWPQHSFTHGEKDLCLVGHVLRHETLKADWAKLPFRIRYPDAVINASLQPDKASTSETIQRLIREIYATDYDLFYSTPANPA